MRLRPRATVRTFTRAFCLAVCVLGFAPPLASSRLPRVSAILSQDAAQYQETLDGFRRSLVDQGLHVDLQVHVLEAGHGGTSSLSCGAEDETEVVLALGSAATQTAARECAQAPIVSGLVLRASEFEKLPNATGVFLDFPPDVELDWMRKVLPRRKRIGVLFNPEENERKVERATAAARSLWFEILPRRVETPSQIPGSLDSLAKEADALWGIADSVVLTPQTAQAFLLFSLRNRIPFIGLSLPWVKAGALYALDRDYEDIGRQCAGMTARILKGEPASAVPPSPPRKVVYFINRRTAAHMRLDLPPQLLKEAKEVVE